MPRLMSRLEFELLKLGSALLQSHLGCTYLAVNQISAHSTRLEKGPSVAVYGRVQKVCLKGYK